MKFTRMLVLATLLLPLTSSAATLRLWVRAPEYNADNGVACGHVDSSIVTPEGVVFLGTPLTDLKEILLVGKRFIDADSLLFDPIPAIGREGDSIAVDLDILDGSMGSVWSYARDMAGNLSCRGAEFVFAFPASEPPPVPPPGAGGLRTLFYSWDAWNDYKALLHEQTDTTVNFDYGAGNAFPGGPADYFSARTTGTINIPTAGAWTFYVGGSDGRRLTIAGTLVQDMWTRPITIETTNTMVLPAGPAPVLFEWYEGWGNASRSLSWSGPGIPKQVIPRWALQP